MPDITITELGVVPGARLGVEGKGVVVGGPEEAQAVHLTELLIFDTRDMAMVRARVPADVVLPIRWPERIPRIERGIGMTRINAPMAGDAFVFTGGGAEVIDVDRDGGFRVRLLYARGEAQRSVLELALEPDGTLFEVVRPADRRLPQPTIRRVDEPLP